MSTTSTSSATGKARRWIPRLRLRGRVRWAEVSPAAGFRVTGDPPRDAAQLSLPMLSAVADHLRRLGQQPDLDDATRAELDATLEQVEALVQGVWARAVGELGSPTAGDAVAEEQRS